MDLTLSLTQDKRKLCLSGIKQIVYGYNWNFKKTHLSINPTKTLACVFVVDTFNSRRCRSEVSSLYFDLCFISFITISSHFFLNNDSIDRVFLIIFLSLKIYLYQFYVLCVMCEHYEKFTIGSLFGIVRKGGNICIIYRKLFFFFCGLFFRLLWLLLLPLRFCN